MTSIKSIVDAQNTVTVDPSMSVMDAARVMARHQIGAVPVLEGDQLRGIFTERDLLARVVAAGHDTAATSIAEVMSTSLVTAEVTETYQVCLQRMQVARVRHLIVLDGGRLAGVLSLRDLLAVDLDEKDEAIALLHAYVHDVPPGTYAKA